MLKHLFKFITDVFLFDFPEKKDGNTCQFLTRCTIMNIEHKHFPFL